MNAITELLENVILESEDLPNLQELALKAQVELTQMLDIKNEAQARLVELRMKMPCGHLARYAVNGEDGTQYCCMCLCASVTGTDDPKIQAKIAEIINHE